jgi:hypothetical protein
MVQEDDGGVQPPITGSNVTALTITRRRVDLRALFIVVLSTGEQPGLKHNWLRIVEISSSIFIEGRVR